MCFVSINFVEQPKNMRTIDTNTKTKMALAKMRNNDDALGYTHWRYRLATMPSLPRMYFRNISNYFCCCNCVCAPSFIWCHFLVPTFLLCHYIRTSAAFTVASSILLALMLLSLKRQMIVSVICFYFVAFKATNRPYHSGERKKN